MVGAGVDRDVFEYVAGFLVVAAISPGARGIAFASIWIEVDRHTVAFGLAEGGRVVELPCRVEAVRALEEAAASDVDDVVGGDRPQLEAGAREFAVEDVLPQLPDEGVVA